jgi:autotransporter translocation and assembly factor TamB
MTPSTAQFVTIAIASAVVALLLAVAAVVGLTKIPEATRTALELAPGKVDGPIAVQRAAAELGQGR